MARPLARGFGLERFKGALYVLAPVAAVVLYAQPAVHETALRSRRYVVYVDSDLPVLGGRGRAARGAGEAAPAAEAAAAAAPAAAEERRSGGRFGNNGGLR
jgi:hypothetical protein